LTTRALELISRSRSRSSKAPAKSWAAPVKRRRRGRFQRSVRQREAGLSTGDYIWRAYRHGGVVPFVQEPGALLKSSSCPPASISL